MNFAAPYFLYALAAVAIPVIVHLFDLQRPKRVFFTNVKLLKNINEQTSSTRKLKSFWVMVCRILAIIFLVLAFAQPFLKGDNAESAIGNQSVAVYIDNSLSMQNSDGQKPLLELARKTAEQLTEVFSPATQYFYIDNGFLPKDRKTLTSETFKDRLTETGYTSVTRNFENIYRKQKSVISGISSKKVKLFWLSDFQKSTAGNLPIDIDSSISLYLVPFQSNSFSNVYVDSVWLDNVFVKENENNILKVRLKNSGNKSIDNLHLKFSIDGVQTGLSSVEIQASGSITTSFNFSIKNNNLKKCAITIDDSPIVFDNTYFFTINIAPTLPVLLVSDNKNSFISKVYSTEEIFKVSQINFQSFPQQSLAGFQLVVVEGFDKLSSQALENLRNAKKQGISLLLIPSAQVSLENAQSVFNALNLPSVNKLELYDNDKSLDLLASPDFKNPFFANIFDVFDKNIDMPYGKPSLKPIKSGISILKNKSENDFLSLYNTRDNKVFLLTTPLEDNKTNFHKHSIFVPIMYKIATTGANVNKELAYNFDYRKLQVLVQSSGTKQRFSLKNRDFVYMPEQSIQGNILIMDIPSEGGEAGFYDVMLKDSVITTLAINVPKSESDLKYYQAKELEKLFESYKNVQLYSNTNNDSFVSDFKAAHVGISLWKYCVLLSLLFLLIEILLIRILK